MKVVRLALVLTLALMIMPPTTVAQTLEQLWQQGETAQAQKKYPEAERIWRQIIQLDPNSAVAFSNLCAALFRQNKLDEALIFCQKALALDPKLPETYNNLGNVLRVQKKLTEAEEMYRRAIELDDKYVRAYNGLGIVLANQKKLTEAEEMFRRALALDDKYVFAYIGLGNVLRAQKKLTEAEEMYRRALALDDKDVDAYNNLGNLLYDQKKLTEAEEMYRKALALDDKFVFAYYNLGNVLRDQKKLTEAEEMYRKALALDDQYVNAYNNLGIVLANQKKLTEAEEMYRRALALDDKLAPAYIGLGNVLRAQKKLTEAEEMYRRALDLPDTTGTPTTTHTLAHNNLGRLLQEQGKLEAAIAEFEKATKIDPKFEFTRNNLQEAWRLLSLQQQPEQIIALNTTKYLPQEDPLTRIKRSIVKISVVFTGNAKGTAYGTGYVIKRRGTTVWIITNRHVVVDRDTEQRGDNLENNLEVEPYYGENLPNLPRDRAVAKISQITEPQENLDLALLEVTGLPDDISPLTFHQGEIAPNTPISIIGHPESKDWSKYEAITIGIQSSSGNLLIDVSLAVGGSGSPVFDQEMRVIGLMFKTINESQIDSSGIGFAYPIDRVLQKLAQWQVVVP
ncbi:MAG: tetratricopeptide repeat protein [Microcystis sp. M53603_WE2]|jgi:superkiller protein 3|uniref:serine protease n=1 Tax=unclassified Microcystis TaxID=2643300 RepID=UPI00258BED2E|nr:MULTISPECIES: serine protease [unclassified Microcystis]MCE2663580.1 tetratricopeptide repeat protein [Microcystis sp. 53602_E8]MDJ0537619.1 tetratricopeptide repeat protein [Microcystis sp. M53603_WE2]MDJ0565213.1 tetratricopeptide repeat protein [Microcystis sp. M49629_WE12]MDJ0603768.1 tetratricopeptide repeat protein [Microcystis sp. M53602_WE12]